MNNTKKIAEEVERHAQAMSGIVAERKKTILSLPDNPRIKRTSGNPHCFTMSFKDFGTKNMSVENYDFKLQYELVVGELERCEPEGIIKRLLTIIGEKKIMVKGNRLYPVTLHDDVLSHLCKIAGISGIRWVSHADWPAGTCTGDHSDDTHDTRSQAESVCMMLRTMGFGGDRKICPLKTWVEPVGIPVEVK